MLKKKRLNKYHERLAFDKFSSGSNSYLTKISSIYLIKNDVEWDNGDCENTKKNKI